MNKFVKLPLFLGAVCLIAGGLLSGVYALTEETIVSAQLAKKANGYKVMYETENASVVSSLDFVDTSKGLLNVSVVEHDGVSSAVYECKSKNEKGFETMTFYVGFDKETQVVDGYYCLTTDTQSLGYGLFKDSSSVMEMYQGYDGSQNVISSGITWTSLAVQKCVDNALADLKTRTEWGA